MKKVLVTGASGLIGSRLCAHLRRSGWGVAAGLRTAITLSELEGCVRHYVSDINATEEWLPALRGADIVIHLAARVHVIHDTEPDPLAVFRRVNTAGTLALARAAAAQGVSRFLFVSTIGVNGQFTESRPFSESDVPAPTTQYSVSKWEAEQGLAQIARETGLQVVIVRPPLVYGPRVKGNFLHLMELIRHRLPLPLSSIMNSRSFIYVGNLVSALENTLTADLPQLVTFLVSDDHDLSTPELIKAIAAAMEMRPTLLPCPPAVLRAFGQAIGKNEEMRRILESLSVDCSLIKRELLWCPPYSVEEGILDTVRWFKQTLSRPGAGSPPRD